MSLFRSYAQRSRTTIDLRVALVRMMLVAFLVASSLTGLLPLSATWLPLVPSVPVAYATAPAFPYSESFDTLTTGTTMVPSGWVQVVSDGSDTGCSNVAAACNDWIVDNNNTPSAATGPSNDHTGGGNYLYVEASDNSNATVELQSPAFTLSGSNTPILTFWVHRYDGNNAGASHELHIDIMNSAGNTVLQSNALVINNAALDQNAWVQQTVDLAPYKGNGAVRLRFRWVNAPGVTAYSPDIAIDDIYIEDTDPHQIRGVAFEDFNANGLQDAHEPGIEGIEVYVIDQHGASATTTTLADGAYLIATGGVLTDSVRLEFTLPPDGSLDFLRTGAGGETQVQLIAAIVGTVIANVGFNDPVNYCQANPTVAVTTLFDGQYNGIAADHSALVTLPFDATGHDFTSTNPVTRTAGYQGTDLTTFGELGAVYGMAWQRTTDRIYVSAFHKRYSSFGPNGPDAIYQVDPSGNVTGVIELDPLLGITNSAGADAHDFTPVSGVVYDIGVGNSSFDGVGKRSFGDLEISSDMATLYVINLFDRKLYAIDVRAGNVAAATLVQTWDLPDATGANRHRPYGLAWHNGKLWVGSVDENGSAAYVHALDPAGSTFTLQLTVSLSYTRQDWIWDSAPNLAATWHGWQSDPNTLPYAVTASGGEIAYPQPMLSDIAFDGADMVLGLRDRFGDQSGAAVYFTPAFTQTIWGDAAGDILRACSTPAGYIAETGTTGACANPIAGEGGMPSGPGGYEYYFWDIWEDSATWQPGTASGAFHWETTQGGLLQLPGQPSVTTTVMDPFSDFSAGLLRLDHATGRREGSSGLSQSYANLAGGYTIYDSANYTSSYPAPSGNTFANANGLGDIEALCIPAPLEIGNRVWEDEDGDGLQDPAEPGIANVVVDLVAPDGSTVLATATTDANGTYFFSTDTTRSSTASHQFGVAGLNPSTAGYAVRIAMTQTALFDMQTTRVRVDSGPHSELRDADGSEVDSTALALVTTGAAGENDHTVDFGFVHRGAITGHLFTDRDGNGSEEIDEPPLPLITVVITDALGLTHTVQTDSNGDYTVTVPVGTTTIDIIESTLPIDYSQSAGSDPTIATVSQGSATDAGIDGFQPPRADLLVVKYDELDPMIAGTVLTYTIVITNFGPNDARNVVVTDTLPVSTTFQWASPGCISNDGVSVTCSLGTIAANSVVSVTIGVLVDGYITYNPGSHGRSGRMNEADWRAIPQFYLSRWPPYFTSPRTDRTTTALGTSKISCIADGYVT